ncbi:sensor domain-containing protein [Plantactinospora veratri]|uniref:histidine kinase n=1 Tax=Plantactinospora veratri TaxID=1436122 RepID=A0ABU7SGC3_9ACTN
MPPVTPTRSVVPPRWTGPVTDVVATVLRAPVDPATWRLLGYALLAVPLSVPVFPLALLGLVAAVSSLAMVGLPILVAVLRVARATIVYFRWPARSLLGWDWAAPPTLRGRGPLDRARAVLGDAPAWQALLYCLLKLPLAALTGYLAGLALLGGVYCLTCPVWSILEATRFGPVEIGAWTQSWYVAGTGAGLLLLLPWLLRALVGLDRILMAALLAPGPARQRIARLESDRAVLAADAATTLRRVERDLHDGTQARLVSLGMMLSRIAHRVDRLPRDTANPDGLPAELDALVGTARDAVTDALTELRDIVRRVHPPALDDGLPVALTTLATRSGLPVEVSVALAGTPSDATATTVYFTAAELLANAARHAGGARVRLRLDEHDGRVRLVVVDDGPGGAAPSPAGSGLTGLSRRARALGGSFEVVSPAGGPTTVTVTLPREG